MHGLGQHLRLHNSVWVSAAHLPPHCSDENFVLERVFIPLGPQLAEQAPHLPHDDTEQLRTGQEPLLLRLTRKPPSDSAIDNNTTNNLNHLNFLISKTLKKYLDETILIFLCLFQPRSTPLFFYFILARSRIFIYACFG